MKKILLLILISISIRSFAQYPNIRISKPTSTTPEEVTIAINPTNPLNLAAGANINYSYYSTDGGLTWIEGTIQSASFGVWGDPCVTYDLYGNLYYGHLSQGGYRGYWLDRIVVQKSTDGGMTWNDGAGIGFNPPSRQQDKEWLATDMTNSPYRGNIYAAWTQFDTYYSLNPSDSSRILFALSTDTGLNWSLPVRVSDRAGNCLDDDSTVEGAVPAVGPNGEVYLSWSGPLGIMFDKSTDGGLTWGEDVFVTSQPGGWDFYVSGTSRCNGFPVTACDVSTSQHRGNIYINWSDQRNGTGNTDIFLIKSLDGGKTWGAVKRVNDDTSSRQQFFSWMAVDQSTGNIYIVFYDRRNTTGDSTDVYVAKSIDGGDTFTNFKVSDSSSLLNAFIGDYINIAARDRKIYPIWTRQDPGVLSVWTAIITDTTTVGVREKDVARQFHLEQNYPNPFNPSTVIRYQLPERSWVRLKVYNLLGQEVAKLVDGVQDAGFKSVEFNAQKLQSGVYYYELIAGGYKETKKMIFIK